MQVLELPNWPPQVRGKHGPLALSAEEVRINDVVQTKDKAIAFTRLLENRSFSYSYSAPDLYVAQQLVVILRNNKGMSLASIARIRIPTYIRDQE